MKCLQRVTVLLREEVRKYCREGLRTLAKEVLRKLREHLVKLVALLLLTALVIVAAGHLPSAWVSRLRVVLREIGVRESLLPHDPMGLTHIVPVNEAGFGYMTLFAEVARDATEIIKYDPMKLPRVLVCHPGRYVGKNAVEALLTFARQHPRCFSVRGRPGGGFEIEPIEVEGDFLFGGNGRIIAFACECRQNLEQVRAKFLQEQGLGGDR